MIEYGETRPVVWETAQLIIYLIYNQSVAGLTKGCSLAHLSVCRTITTADAGHR